MFGWLSRDRLYELPRIIYNGPRDGHISQADSDAEIFGDEDDDDRIPYWGYDSDHGILDSDDDIFGSDAGILDPDDSTGVIRKIASVIWRVISAIWRMVPNGCLTRTRAIQL